MTSIYIICGILNNVKGAWAFSNKGRATSYMAILFIYRVNNVHFIQVLMNQTYIHKTAAQENFYPQINPPSIWNCPGREGQSCSEARMEPTVGHIIHSIFTSIHLA